MEVKIAGVPVTQVTAADIKRRISLLLWGTSGCGKTTLASTAPGKKLWLNFDPDGLSSVATRDDVIVADFSDQRAGFTEKYKGDNPLQLRQFLEDNPDVETVVGDSLTNATQLALLQGISVTKGATIERPSPGAYGVRNALTLQLVKGLLRVTGKLKRHMIFIAHEASPVTNDDGVVLFITVMLGGQLPNQASVDFSEVWNLSQTESGKHRIATRPVRSRRPMKTRMFKTTGAQEFDWLYNPETGEGDGIEKWYNAWKENNYEKIPTPKGKK